MSALLYRSILVSALLVTGARAAPAIERVAKAPNDLVPLAAVTRGRVQNLAAGWRYQWPGTYAETAFSGTEAFLRVGPEPAVLHVLVDGVELEKLVSPASGLYRVSGMAPGAHVLRIESASENQGGPVSFGGFAARPATQSAKLPARARQIEFIGDSHTVGYGNTSGKRACTQDEIWATTDTSQAFGPLVAKHYGADYQVNAISGRGVVRNYNGFKADSLPAAYPFMLFDKAARADDAKWVPQVVAVALGTNDFSTPLNPGERWSSRDELHADFENTYVKFLQTLRTRAPGALLVVWATDLSEGEIQAEARKVVERFKLQDKNVVFVPVNALAMTGCDWHPSVEDDRTISKAIIEAIDARAAWPN